jgi:hypothetical protein
MYAEYTAVYNAMTNKPDATNAGYQNAMVKALVDGGYWARMDLFYVLAQQSNAAGEAYLNWINPAAYTCTVIGDVTFTSLEGVSAAGVGFLRTEWTPSTHGVNYTLNSGTIAVYDRTESNLTEAIAGASDGTYELRLFPRASGNMVGAVNSEYSYSTTNSTSLGLPMTTRTGISAYANYMNGSPLGNDTFYNSNGLPTVPLVILAIGLGGSNGSANYTGQASIALVMDGVNNSDASAIYTIIQAYMTSIGKQV